MQFYFISFVFLLLTVSSVHSVNRNQVFDNKRPEIKFFEDEILQIFNCTRELFKNGIPELEIPSLEDIKLPYMEINIDDFGIDGAKGYIILNNTIISGITDLELSNLKIDPILIGGFGLSLKAKLSIPKFVISTDYNGDFTFKNYEIYGNGELKHKMDSIGLNLDTALMITNKHKVNLAKFRAVPSVKDVELQITGFFNDDEQCALLSQLVDEEGKSWINGKAEDIADEIEHFMQNLINVSVITTLFTSNYLNINDIVNIIFEKCSPHF